LVTLDRRCRLALALGGGLFDSSAPKNPSARQPAHPSVNAPVNPLAGPVLGIESSCDETGVALCAADGELLAHALHSQVDVHALYGGVVPEVASRDSSRIRPRFRSCACWCPAGTPNWWKYRV